MYMVRLPSILLVTVTNVGTGLKGALRQLTLNLVTTMWHFRVVKEWYILITFLLKNRVLLTLTILVLLVKSRTPRDDLIGADRTEPRLRSIILSLEQWALTYGPNTLIPRPVNPVWCTWCNSLLAPFENTEL